MPRRPSGKMSRPLRAATLVICALLWLSGALWMILHYLYPGSTDFGPAPNRWEPLTIRLHGVLAIATIFLLGWITSRHITHTWYQHRNRISGIALSGACAILVISGYALYYLVDDQARYAVAILHEILGASAITFALVHWLQGIESGSDVQN
jgi:hypothetical protein